MSDTTVEEYRWKARAMLIRDEGLKLKAYKCTAGFWTVGVGRNLSARGTPLPKLLYYKTVGISRETAMKWLDEDIHAAEMDCEAIFGPKFWRWSIHRRLGWLNLVFNLGRHRLLKFRNTIRHAMNEDWHKVRLHLMNSAWYVQVKSRAERVIALICDERWTYG